MADGRGFGSPPNLQVAGGTAYGVGYTLDGANHIDFMSVGNLPMPFPDALQEFKVNTSGVSSEQGYSAGISGVTKSGTNDLHGDAFEFLRNGLFNARNYFAQTAPFGNVTVLVSPVVGLDDPWQGYPGGNPFPYAADDDDQPQFQALLAPDDEEICD